MNSGEHHHLAQMCLCSSHRIHQFATVLYDFLQYAQVTNKHPTAVILDEIQSCFQDLILQMLRENWFIFSLHPTAWISKSFVYISYSQSTIHFLFLLFQYGWNFNIYFLCLRLRAKIISCTCFSLTHSLFMRWH